MGLKEWQRHNKRLIFSGNKSINCQIHSKNVDTHHIKKSLF